MSCHNQGCEGQGNCARPSGRAELRRLPTGGDGASIVCRACYTKEIIYRQERNRTLSPDCQFKLPLWHELTVYKD